MAKTIASEAFEALKTRHQDISAGTRFNALRALMDLSH